MKNIILMALATIGFLSVSFINNDSFQEPKLKQIFNGKNLKGWSIDPQDQENLWWTANDGILSLKSDPEMNGSTLWTSRSYGDFVIQMDFKYGKGTVDSGIFIRTKSRKFK